MQTSWSQGFRVYKSDGTMTQFSLRTDSIVFYDGIGSDEDFGPFTPVNQCIVGTWYKTKSDSITFNEDGTTDYLDGATYKFYPYQGNIVFYNAFGAPVNIYKVYELSTERMVIGDINGKWNNDSNFLIINRTPIQRVTRIELSEYSITFLHTDDTMRLSAIVYPEDADNPLVTWESSDETVAQVINQGLVVAVGDGTCAIICRATDGSGVYAECKVTCGLYTSYCPTWYGFTYYTGNYPDYVQGTSGNDVYLTSGDSVHVTACQKDRGHLINATDYSWALCYDTLNTAGISVHVTKTYNQHTNYDGYVDGDADPVCHMLLPSNALPTESGKPDTIKFVARYSYSGQGGIIDNGNIVDNTSYNGRITPQSGPFGGGAVGNFFFNVTAGGTHINCAEAVELTKALADGATSTETYSVTGYITEVISDVSRNLQSFWMADTKDGGKVFEAYWANLPEGVTEFKVGMKVKITGQLMKYVKNGEVTPEIKNADVVVLEQGEGGGGQGGDDSGGQGGGGGDPVTDLVNGDFENWVSDSQPAGWKSASSASNATLSKSTDARGGNFSCMVAAPGTQNKRLATQEMTLEAGSYTFSFYAKSTTTAVCQSRGGYVPVNADGSVGAYTYNKTYTDLNNSGWTLVSYDFELSSKTTLCLIVMNPKGSNYSVSQDILVDVATLIKW